MKGTAEKEEKNERIKKKKYKKCKNKVARKEGEMEKEGKPKNKK